MSSVRDATKPGARASSSSTRDTDARAPSAAAASSVIATRSSYGASALANGWRQVGTNHSSSIGCVSSTSSPTSWCATCGGLKLPPKSATVRMAPL